MRNETYQATLELKEKIKTSEEYLDLLKKEKEMESNQEVMALAYQVDQCSSFYSDVLSHFPEDSIEVKEARQKLYFAKKALDEHPLVEAYLKAYQKVRLILEEVNDILFKDISIDLCKKKETK